jgi:hypothetical protein
VGPKFRLAGSSPTSGTAKHAMAINAKSFSHCGLALRSRNSALSTEPARFFATLITIDIGTKTLLGIGPAAHFNQCLFANVVARVFQKFDHNFARFPAPAA